MNRNNAVISR